MSGLAATAVGYIRRGWRPVPLPFGEKAPALKAWPELQITEAEVPRYFNGAGNVGIILGEPSGGLVDLDLDCAEALALAPALMPPTDAVFGRQSKPRSHMLYVAPVPKRIEYTDPDTGECLLEVRSTGTQTAFPGSTHPSGEEVEWIEDDDPAPVDAGGLTVAAGKLAAACLLVRAAPAEGRHNYLLNVCGALVRSMGEAGAAHVMAPVERQILGSLFSRDAGARLIADTKRKLDQGEPVTGWPSLATAIGEKRARKVAEWLGLSEHATPDSEHAHQAWPAPLALEAFHGIAGEIVRRIEPETEADPAGLMFSLLAAAGNVFGAERYIRVESDKHPGRLYVDLVGRTSRGRKGTAMGRIMAVLEKAEYEWASKRTDSGLSSGEGVIHAVRDPLERQETDKESKRKATVVADEGVSDKRLLLIESEFAKVLRNMERQGNVLSAVMRDAWDHGNLRNLTKNAPCRATGAHISMIGHVTIEELRYELNRTEMANGLANRLLFVCVQRSKLLPRGGRAIDWKDLSERLGEVFRCAPRGEILRTDAAWAIWEAVYPTLSADRPGLLGAILGRAEAQVLRLALIYALLDGQEFIDAPHMLAALACWDYSEASARFIFGDALGSPVADEILRALRESPEGMTRNELVNHFGRNLNSAQLDSALGVLARGNFAACTREPTGGRPADRWRAAAGGGGAARGSAQQSYLRLGREGLNSFTSFISLDSRELERAKPAPAMRVAAYEISLAPGAVGVPVHEINEENEVTTAWTAADAWVAEYRGGRSREEKADIIRAWGRAAGGTVDEGGELHLPPGLASCFASVELTRLARDVGVMPKLKARF